MKSVPTGISSVVSLLTVYVVKGGKRFMAKRVELDLVTEMDTPEAALTAIRVMIEAYAEDDGAHWNRNLNSPNRAHHKPYVERILSGRDPWELMELIEVR
jgi:hypothetical protein